MTQKTTHVKVEGRVQGVFFRDYTQRKALEYNLTGWVRNCADGSVETLLCGSEQSIQAMIDWLHEGSPLSNVTKVTVSSIEAKEAFSTFEVRF